MSFKSKRKAIRQDCQLARLRAGGDSGVVAVTAAMSALVDAVLLLAEVLETDPRRKEIRSTVHPEETRRKE